ncbi:MAG: nicotinate (nicotinamide) nucleotide adenylyltransferase [Candidatus Melainabacteria bacterium RIFCSPLOWO2_12_FULL_35_11]|nr:MAG: nicotinate (nicotinamide) nucleotide adenylyltransferase [Candidatus Melainabacteria bacterium RIFCSPLOWO2_12_FULL_35_11]
MKRIGIFGGTFNPVHHGHLKMAEAARKEYKLSCIYFIPCGIPSHKQKKDLLPAKTRYKLIKKALKGKKYFKVLDIEIKKKKPAYTIDTILSLQSNDVKLFFLIGQDEFEKLHTWNKANKLAKLVTFLVLPRHSKKIKLPKVKKLKWFKVHTKPINISSTEIRGKLLFFCCNNF